MSLSDNPIVAGAAPFVSLAELRREHVEVVRATRSNSEGDAKREKRIASIQDFMRRAQATGSRIEALSDRDIAQSILDYWAAELLALGVRERTYSLSTLADFNATTKVDLSAVGSPYIGLRPFDEKDSPWFFGRNQATLRLCERILKNRLVVVYGPSGAGKTSLIMAGLTPQLKDGVGIAGSEKWRYIPPFTPGADPFGALLSAVRPPGTDATDWVAAQKSSLERRPERLEVLLDDGPSAAPCLFIVDQIEELFAFAGESAEKFIAALSSLAAKPSPLHRAILIVRQDYLASTLQSPTLASLDPNALYSPPALNNQELRAVIDEPAKKVGLRFQDGIVADLVSNVIGEPTAMPLLQFTLAQLWDRRDHDWISWSAYQAVGRPMEALKATAEKAYDELGMEDQELARRIFLELVRPGGGTEFVRRRLGRGDLSGLVRDNGARVENIIEVFTKAGIIREIAGGKDRETRFEVAHETLLRNWPRLATWLEDSRKQSEKGIQLINAVKLWDESKGQEGYLFTGSALKQASQLVASSPELIDAPNVRRFMDASRAYEWMTRLRIFIAGAATAVFIAGMIPAYDFYLSSRKESLRRELEVTTERWNQILTSTKPQPNKLQMESGLRWLADNGRKLDFNGINLTGINLSGIQTRNAVFRASKLNKVDLSKAEMEYVDFSQSEIQDSDFTEATLTYARFEAATFLGMTSFANTNLNNVVFDRARFCGDVDFSMSDVELASFRDVQFQDGHVPNFYKTAWWLAAGWQIDQVEKLIGQTGGNRDIYKETIPFRKMMARDEAAVMSRTANGDDRANALNDMAWDLTKYGVDLKGAAEKAREALEILKTAKSNLHATTAEFAEDNLTDTLAYILLQTGEKADALALWSGPIRHALFPTMGREPSSEEKGWIFRYSVALFANGQTEEAYRYLKIAMVDKKYIPSHELYLLSPLIIDGLRMLINELQKKDQTVAGGKC